MDITEDIRSMTEFKRDTTRFVARLKTSGRPAVLTVNGRAELVVIDAGAWQEMQDQLEYARAVAGIRKGLDEMKEGAGVVAGEFFNAMRAEKA